MKKLISVLIMFLVSLTSCSDNTPSNPDTITENTLVNFDYCVFYSDYDTKFENNPVVSIIKDKDALKSLKPEYNEFLINDINYNVMNFIDITVSNKKENIKYEVSKVSTGNTVNEYYITLREIKNEEFKTNSRTSHILVPFTKNILDRCLMKVNIE